MNFKTLIIYESDILFEILEEFKEKLNFTIIKTDKKNFPKINLDDFKNYQIISLRNCELNHYLLIENLPLKINKLLEKINIKFLSNQYSNQSEIQIGKYKLDLNSRKINHKEFSLDLTEKEAEIILFLKDNKKTSLKDLQKNIWGYSQELETHTVETHIYRLRKKISDKFSDNEFIIHDKQGYYLN